MNTEPIWARFLGVVVAAVAITLVALGFCVYECLSSGGNIAGFGTTCQITACPDFPTVGYLSAWMLVPLLVLVAIPVYFTVSTYSPRWFRANRKHDG
jgi:uncharacterized protein involved in cysteine biosynthesis